VNAALASPPAWADATWLALLAAAAGAVFVLVRRLRRQRRRIAELQARWRRMAVDVEHALALLQNLVDGVVTTDRDGVIAWANPAAAALFGHRAATLVGLPCSALLADAGDRPAVAAMCSPAEKRGRRRDGTSFPLDVAVGTLQVDGQPHLLFVLRDATARLEAA
jgi:PAS domain S-box-containing protein